MKNEKTNLNFYKVKINQELERFFEKEIKKASKISLFSKKITQSLADYTLRGGKRIRALFFIYGYQAVTGKIDAEIIKASISMELVQSSLLVHDDIIDQDDLRRGKITIHKEYSKYLSGTDDHFGDSIAIVIGDLAMNFAYKILAESRFDVNNKLKAVSLIPELINQVDYGQAEDILLGKKEDFTKKDIDRVHYYKTATYTILLPLLVSITLAGAKKNIKNQFYELAPYFGRAFQIIDDIIGIFGKEKDIGKPVFSDIQEGKKTLLILKTFEKCNTAEKNRIKKLFNKKNITKEQLEYVKMVMRQTGSLDYSMQKAENLINQGKKRLQKLSINKKAKKSLIFLANYILSKSKI